MSMDTNLCIIFGDYCTKYGDSGLNYVAISKHPLIVISSMLAKITNSHTTWHSKLDPVCLSFRGGKSF